MTRTASQKRKTGKAYCEYTVGKDTSIRTIYAKDISSAYWQLVEKNYQSIRTLTGPYYEFEVV